SSTTPIARRLSLCSPSSCGCKVAPAITAGSHQPPQTREQPDEPWRTGIPEPLVAGGAGCSANHLLAATYRPATAAAGGVPGHTHPRRPREQGEDTRSNAVVADAHSHAGSGTGHL